MLISGWGQYPIIESSVCHPQSPGQVRQRLTQGFQGIPRGMGRSYGDSSLAEESLDALALQHHLRFDQQTGTLVCQAGVTLADILSVFVPRGWFLPVTPGTKFVSVGGAIASDVHGKNHHVHGSFSEYVDELQLMLANGETLNCSRTQHPELFHATCGGMGLTGVILQARLRLKPINSPYIDERTFKAGSLDAVLELFERHADATYSVAWMDSCRRGRRMGRSLLMLGEHCQQAGPLRSHDEGKLSLPVNLPDLALNPFTIHAFNSLYYHRMLRRQRQRRIHYEPYFYPLDGVHHWNRIYGKRGFTQYQFVIPREAGREGLHAILKRIVDSRHGSLVSVLKAFGPENDNYLSFPRAGYTLALDFKLVDGIFEFLNELDSIVLDHDGRLYLTKDVRMDEAMFKRGYPRWQEFRRIREQYGAVDSFHSLQSKRLGI